MNVKNVKNDVQTPFGKAVRDARLSRGWSQRRLTAEAGLASHTVRDAESSRICTTLKTAIRLADAFEFSETERKAFLATVPFPMPRNVRLLDRSLTTPLGETLCRHRETARLSVSELAALSGYTQGHVTNIETGKRVPTRKAILTLSGALDIDARDRDELLLMAGYAPDWAKDVTIQQCALLLATLPMSTAQAWRRQIAVAWEKVQSRKKEA